MDLVSVVLFLVMYYIRPQEWGHLFAKIHFVQLVMYMAVASLIFRERSLKLRDFLKTPHDWMMLLLFVWMIGSSRDSWTTFQNNYPLAVFYIVIVQSLTTGDRLRTFVGWWTFLIVTIALLAISSEYGFDPLGGNDITHGRMKDRLILNLWIFNNPNALGHNVAPCIPMLYFFCIWKRPLFFKQLGSALLLIPLYCVYLTASKGAMITSGVILVTTLVFGRPKTVQIAIVVAAGMFGTAVFYQLPRMNELQHAKSDAAIEGRVVAFMHGYKILTEDIRGVGRDRWVPSFFRAHHYNKACHSSYVQIGAETGIPGLFLYLGVLYCCLRTLMTAKIDNPGDERVRRTLFVLVMAYMISSWMVDFGFRPTFFMFSAAIAAFHRHLYKLNEPEPETEEEAETVPAPAWRARLTPQPALSRAMVSAGGPAGATVFTMAPVNRQPWLTRADAEKEADEEAAKAPRFWNKIGLVDIALIALMTYVTIQTWAFMIRKM